MSHLGYDANIRLAEESVNGQSVAYLYDPDDLLTQAGELMLTRDPTSGDITATKIGGTATSFARNGYGELDHQAFQVGASMLFSLDIVGRDDAGRITSRRETIDNDSHTTTHMISTAI